MAEQRLIDAISLSKHFDDLITAYHCMNTARGSFAANVLTDAAEIIFSEPTVDAVPVVRCRECVYWESGENEAEKWEYCLFHHIDIESHSFCSHGERRSE